MKKTDIRRRAFYILHSKCEEMDVLLVRCELVQTAKSTLDNTFMCVSWQNNSLIQH